MRILILMSLFLSAFAMAALPELSVDSFQQDSVFDNVEVETAERVFYDELTYEQLYRVSYLVEGECASAGESDACELISVCEYFWVQEMAEARLFIEPTHKTCDTHIEDILKPVLIDEY